MALDIDGLLTFATQQNVSDVFFKEDAPPVLRLNGSIRKLDMPPLTPADLDQIAQHIMPPNRWQEFLEHPDHDCAYIIPNVARFRVNVYRQRGSVALCLRVVQLKIRSFQDLGLPEVIADFTRHHDGLVLVTGPTGSGKSTTLAAMIDLYQSGKTRPYCHHRRPD